MRRTPKHSLPLGCTLGAAALAGALVSLPARSAQAYGDGIDINKFHPAPGNEKMVTVDLAEVGPHLQVVPQLFVHYANVPLVYTLGGIPKANLIEHRLTGDVSVSIALWRRLQIALSLPVTFYQTGQAPPPPPLDASGQPIGGPPPSANIASAGQEDLRLSFKGVFWNNRNFDILGTHFGIGGVADLSLPTGNASSYLGSRLPSLTLKAVASVNWRRLTASLTFGGLFSSAEQIYNVKTGLGIVFGGGLQVEMFRYHLMPFYAVAEVFGSSVLQDPAFISAKNTPAEATLALKTSYREWTFFVGGGPGISPGFGVPNGRAYLGATYAWRSIPQVPKPEAPHDECPNLPGAQRTMPPGMIKNPAGECVMPPPPPPPPPPPEPPMVCGPDQEGPDCHPKPKPAHVEVKKDRLVLTERIFFDFDKDTIKPISFGILDEVVQVLQARLDIKRMQIEGHTDNKGSDPYNLNLSNKRAASVVRYLKEHGVSADRLSSIGFGFRCPLVSNATPDGQAQNRRVDFIILEQDGVEPIPPTCKRELLLKK
jgi:outer membrane protein OmpA-like peptidoglycan-associated protein